MLFKEHRCDALHPIATGLQYIDVLFRAFFQNLKRARAQSSTSVIGSVQITTAPPYYFVDVFTSWQGFGFYLNKWVDFTAHQTYRILCIAFFNTCASSDANSINGMLSKKQLFGNNRLSACLRSVFTLKVCQITNVPASQSSCFPPRIWWPGEHDLSFHSFPVAADWLRFSRDLAPSAPARAHPPPWPGLYPTRATRCFLPPGQLWQLRLPCSGLAEWTEPKKNCDFIKSGLLMSKNGVCNDRTSWVLAQSWPDDKQFTDNFGGIVISDDTLHWVLKSFARPTFKRGANDSVWKYLSQFVARWLRNFLFVRELLRLRFKLLFRFFQRVLKVRNPEQINIDRRNLSFALQIRMTRRGGFSAWERSRGQPVDWFRAWRLLLRNQTRSTDVRYFSSTRGSVTWQR